MTARQVDRFSYLEFTVVVAETGSSYSAIGYDKNDSEVTREEGDRREEVVAAIKAVLNPLSSEFVGIEGAINLFLRAFPGGFDDRFYVHDERDYKDKAAAFIAEQLSERRIGEAVERSDFQAVAKDVRRAFSKTNLVSPFELMALGDHLKRPANLAPFVNSLHALLYGDDFEPALVQMASLLAPSGAAKWPIVTYLPFLRWPDRHVFLKPEITRQCAFRLGYELEYEPEPNGRTYRSFCGLLDTIREGIASLGPRDNIDMQTFMYAVGKEGFVREALAARKKWEVSRG